MSEAVRRWWPIGPRDRARAASALGAIVDAWSAHWVARSVALQVVDADDAGLGPRAEHRWQSADGVDLTLGERPFDRLVRAALDLPDQQPIPFTGMATEVVESLATAMRDDLLARLADGLGVDSFATSRATPADKVSACLSLSVLVTDDDALLRLSLSDDCVRKTLPLSPERPALPAVSSHTALGDSRVQLAAMLGSCDISAAELAGLSVGDVLTTTSNLSRPIPLVVHARDGSTTRLGLAAPVRRGERVSLVIDSIDDAPKHGTPSR